ncbi:MAG: ATP-binding cassette subfamily F protein uup [Limisphaerales bacterium]|jgi:ATP-binding cassette subfamily F protein uup
MLLSADNLSKSYGEKDLFSGIGFHIGPGSKVALVARNGTGKTSLLRILAGVEAPDSGEVILHPDVRLGYLPQEPYLGEGLNILEAVFESDIPQMQALRDYELLIATGESGPALDNAMLRMEELNAWDYESKVKMVLSKLALHDLDRKVDGLSGGEQKRIALAKVLLEEPDLLILDEPTNHLDFEMVEWLEQFLSRERMALLMVTHDRYFLDRVCDEIQEMDRNSLYRYKGNYAYFLEHRETRMESMTRTIEKARSSLKTELEWARRMPKARGTKSKYRMEAVEELRQFASTKIKEEKLEIEIQMERLGSKIVEFHHVNKGYGDRVLIKDLDYKFKRQERIGIIGANGSGKTTLLNMLTGASQPDSGKVVLGETLRIGYYTQETLVISDKKRVIDVVRDIAEYIPMTGGRKLYASGLLERFLFDKHQQYQYVSTLSGGEKRRLKLLTILMRNPNFLILDEPTNDLDIMTLNILEDFLFQFEGCLVIVSHDRYFMDKLVDHLFVFEKDEDGNGFVRDFPGNYTLYRHSVQEEELNKRARKAKAGKQEKALNQDASKTQLKLQAKPASPAVSSKRKLSFKEKREYEQLETDIAKMEERKVALETALANPNMDHEELTNASEEIGQIIKSLDEKSDRWLELAEFV